MTSAGQVQLTCVLPGCSNPVEEQGRPCQECVTEFGDYLRVGKGPGLTAEQQAARDSETMRAYARQHESATAKPPPAAACQPPALRETEEPERKPNQQCWMCEERHTCTKVEGKWECDTCVSIR